MILKNKGGFTLIEVLASIMIFFLLMAAVYAFFIPGQKLYFSGTRQVDLHNSVRQTAERVINKLRFSHFLTLIGEDDWDPGTADTTSYSYIYHDRENQTLVFLDDNGKTILSSCDIVGVSFSANRSTLLFSITAKSGSRQYTLNSSVRLLNYKGYIDSNMPDSTPIAFLFCLDPFKEGEAP